jgi:hypothetical protein
VLSGTFSSNKKEYLEYEDNLECEYFEQTSKWGSRLEWLLSNTKWYSGTFNNRKEIVSLSYIK